LATQEQTPQVTTPATEETLSLIDIAQAIRSELKLGLEQTLRTITLLDEGNTIPFISRYRKEATGSLDEVQIQAIADKAASIRALHERKTDVRRLIDEQGKLTPELVSTLAAATTLK